MPNRNLRALYAEEEFIFLNEFDMLARIPSKSVYAVNEGMNDYVE